jgi:arabinose-5-phosphate isomerase
MLHKEKMNKAFDFKQIALDVIKIERKAIEQMPQRIDDHFEKICELILNSKNRIVVLGMGKSGHIAKKIAATLASTGTPAFFVHPAEACHGDLGMISANDTVLAISYSGETEEIINLLPLIKLLNIPLIAITGNPSSSLGKAAQYVMNVSVDEEACPLGLAPTASTTATLVMGDALAISLLRARGFSATDFARFHPGGSLGKRLLMQVADLMHQGNDMPNVEPTSSVANALVEITQKRLGMTTVTNNDNQLLGVFTDGDLRRTLDHGHDIHETEIQQVMAKNCATVTASMLAVEALNIMRSKKITSLPVVDENKIPVGVIHMHDLLRAGVV